VREQAALTASPVSAGRAQDLIQHLLDQTADFNLLAVPDREAIGRATLTPGSPEDFFGINGGYGIAFESALHRCESVVEPPVCNGGIQVSAVAGEPAGRLRARCFFGPDGLAWAPGRLPDPTIFDPYRSQPFAMMDVELRLGDCGDGFRGYGLGRTYPRAVGGRSYLLAGGAGEVMEGFGRLAGLAGSFVLTGTFEGLGFLGNVTLRSEEELAPPRQIADPAPESTFLVLRLVREDRRRGDLQMRAVRYRCASGGHPRSARELRQIVGTMEAADASEEMLYTFTDAAGCVVGTVAAAVENGVSSALELPIATDQPSVRLAGFGPILRGTGAFAGVRGMLAVSSLAAPGSQAFSFLHVLHLLDPDGRFRARATRGRRTDFAAPMLRALEAHRGQLIDWRRGFARDSARLGPRIAEVFGRVPRTGDFPILAIEPGLLTTELARGLEIEQPFDPRNFDHFHGPALGRFSVRQLATGGLIAASTLHSHWAATYEQDGVFIQKITGSPRGFYNPFAVTEEDLANGMVDTTINVFRGDVGISGWVSNVSGGAREEMTSVTYDLGDGCLLWMNRVVRRNGLPVEDAPFIVTLEWEGFIDRRFSFFVVGISFDIDFERCDAAVHGETFWTALYHKVSR
jgi:hypothetical protein